MDVDCVDFSNLAKCEFDFSIVGRDVAKISETLLTTLTLQTLEKIRRIWYGISIFYVSKRCDLFFHIMLFTLGERDSM